MTPKVSVMTVTYNHRHFIRETVDSALGQITDFPVEMVVADDASTDGAQELLKELAAEYGPRLRLIQRPQNLGMAENFLQSIEACTGEYIAFLDGDDRWTDSHKLQRQIDAMDAEPRSSLCFHRCRNVGEGFESFLHPSHEKTHWTREDLLRENVMNTSTVVYRRSMIPPFPHWLKKLRAQDWSLHILVAGNGSILYLPEIMAEYRVHPGSSWSSKMRLRQRVESEAEMFRALEPLLSPDERKVANETLCGRVRNLASLALNDGDANAAREHEAELKTRGAAGISRISMLKLRTKLLLPALAARGHKEK